MVKLSYLSNSCSKRSQGYVTMRITEPSTCTFKSSLSNFVRSCKFGGKPRLTTNLPSSVRVSEYPYRYCTFKICIFVQLNWRAVVVVVEYLLLLILDRNVSRFWVSQCCKVDNGMLHLPLVLPWPQGLHCVCVCVKLFVCLPQ